MGASFHKGLAGYVHERLQPCRRPVLDGKLRVKYRNSRSPERARSEILAISHAARTHCFTAPRRAHTIDAWNSQQGAGSIVEGRTSGLRRAPFASLPSPKQRPFYVLRSTGSGFGFPPDRLELSSWWCVAFGAQNKRLSPAISSLDSRASSAAVCSCEMCAMRADRGLQPAWPLAIRGASANPATERGGWRGMLGRSTQQRS